MSVGWQFTLCKVILLQHCVIETLDVLKCIVYSIMKEDVMDEGNFVYLGNFNYQQ